MSTNASDQCQHSSPVQLDSKTRKLKYWGLGLIGVGLVTELFILVYFKSPGPGGWAASIGGMLLCVVGSACYGKAKGDRWWWIALACAIALVPILGPLYFLFGALLAGMGIKSRSAANIVAGIVLILLVLAIAIPNFMTYGARARQSEAKVGLKQLLTAATSMYTERKTYEINDIRQLGLTFSKDPGGYLGYSFWYSVNGIPTAIPGGRRATSPCDMTTPPTTVNVAASTTGFTAAAKGNLDSDSTCDEWSITNDGVVINTLNDIRH